MKVEEIKEEEVFVPIKIELVFETKEEFMLFDSLLGKSSPSFVTESIYDLLQEIRKERNL